MSEWISFEDRLPTEVWGNYLFYREGYAPRIMVWGGFLHDETVTHWMPLPGPPKEK